MELYETLHQKIDTLWVLISAIIIGAIGGIIASYGNAILEKFKVDDVVGAVPVHLFAGVWGTLAVALFGNPDLLGTGLSFAGQVRAQLLGIISIGAYCFIVSYVVLRLINIYSLAGNACPGRIRTKYCRA